MGGHPFKKRRWFQRPKEADSDTPREFRQNFSSREDEKDSKGKRVSFLPPTVVTLAEPARLLATALQQQVKEGGEHPHKEGSWWEAQRWKSEGELARADDSISPYPIEKEEEEKRHTLLQRRRDEDSI